MKFIAYRDTCRSYTETDIYSPSYESARRLAESLFPSRASSDVIVEPSINPEPELDTAAQYWAEWIPSVWFPGDTPTQENTMLACDVTPSRWNWYPHSGCAWHRLIMVPGRDWLWHASSQYVMESGTSRSRITHGVLRVHGRYPLSALGGPASAIKTKPERDGWLLPVIAVVMPAVTYTA